MGMGICKEKFKLEHYRKAQKMTSTTNWIYSGTNTANGNVVNGYVITYKVPIYETAIPIILILALLTFTIWLFVWKKKNNSN
jgi:hypothetical protein